MITNCKSNIPLLYQRKISNFHCIQNLQINFVNFLSGFDRHISRSKTANLFAVYLKLFLWRGNTELRMLKTRRKLTVKRRNSLRYFDVHTHINLSLFLSQIFYSSFRSSKTKVKRNDCNACFFFAPSANFTRTSAVSVNFL